MRGLTISYLYAKIILRLHGKSVKNSRIDKTAVIYSGCNISNCTMGRYSYISYHSQVNHTDIGAFCCISDHVFIGGDEHPMSWVSMSPVFSNVIHSGPKKRFSRHLVEPIKRTNIGNDVWIGHGATIKAGVNIGNGAVIGSNSVVTKDVPAYAVVAGAPAKIIKYRFDINLLTQLEKSRWWEFSDNKLMELASSITDPQKFLDSLREI